MDVCDYKIKSVKVNSTCTIRNSRGTKIRLPRKLPRVVVRVRSMVAVRRSWPFHNSVRSPRRGIVDTTARPRPRVLGLVAGVPVVLQPLYR